MTENKKFKKIRILFISRAFPPTTGGIETQNYQTYKNLSKHCEVHLIKNSHGKYFLPVFLPYALIRSLASFRYDAILLGDGVLSMIGYFIKVFRRKPIVSFLHGLDVTFENRIYQLLWPKLFLPGMDLLIVPSRATYEQALEKGIPENRLILIPDGVEIPDLRRQNVKPKSQLSWEADQDSLILVTIGRLVRRKGVEWFIRNCAPKLKGEWNYYIAGEGKEKDRIQIAIKDTGLSDHIHVLGAISDNQKISLYQAADIFIQPNISVAGDIEGFGLVVLEAASYGVPVVASDIDGLSDAITHNKNGFLVPEKDADAFCERISFLQENRDFSERFGIKARTYCEKNLTWDHMANRIVGKLDMLIKKNLNIGK